MPGGSLPKNPPEQSKPLISPPPYSLTGAGAADIAADYSRANTLAAKSHALPSSLDTTSVLKPRSGTDIVALIFILLSMPQGISCIFLTAYILSNTFKTLAAKVIAKCLIRFDSGQHYSMESTSRSRYYRSELIGEFLQLFSINSFILLVCHYTMPHSWFKYLIVLAKSIIASRLIGSYRSGSNTYVSVVSSSAASPGVMITTTTMCNGENSQRHHGNDFFAQGFVKFFQGTFVVLTINFFIKKWLHNLTFGAFCEGLVLFYRRFVLFQEDPKFTTADFVKKAIEKSPIFLQPFASKHSAPAFPGFGDSRFLEEVIVNFASDHLRLGRNVLGTLRVVSREFSTVINYAYLVLCIHVISLTISPILKKFFILRNYSNTLEHLSSLTPEIPYGGFKNNGTSATSKETPSDFPVVLNVESVKPPFNSTGDMPEIQIDSSVGDSNLEFDPIESMMTVSAENFKVFCMSSSSSLQITSGFNSSSKTTVDRKSVVSAITPSTTIMDKLYTISIQPLWSWVAAMKIISSQPSFFTKPVTEPKLMINKRSKIAVSHVEEHFVILENLDGFSGKFSVKVNGVDWPFCDSFPLEKGTENSFLRIYALAPRREYSIEVFENDSLVSSHIVLTSGRSMKSSSDTVSKSVDTLQASLLYSIQSLTHLKAEFKKQKKDDNKRVADLKKKIDAMKSKIGKYGNKESSEVRASGKLKGLQNSAQQLEAEIHSIESLIEEHKSSETEFDSRFSENERQLEQQIETIEVSMKEKESEITRLKAELKGIEAEGYSTDLKLKKLTANLEEKAAEVLQLRHEVKALKKTFLFNLQKRQARVRDRFKFIIPRITEASSLLSKEIKTYLEGVYNQSF